MLLTFPSDILVAIFVIVIFFCICFVIFIGFFNAKQNHDVQNEPEHIRKKSDDPDLPPEGQEDKTIDEVDEKT